MKAQGESGEEEEGEEEEEEVITSGTWRGKHNSLPKKSGRRKERVKKAQAESEEGVSRE